MKAKVSHLSFLFVIIMCVAFTNVSRGIELNPEKELIEETVNLGKSNPGAKIFDTGFVKPAIFGNWPKYGGGLVKTRLIDIAVMSAMMKKGRKSLSEEDAGVLMESNVLTISYRGGDDVYKIKLRQGARLIEPAKMVRPGTGNKGPKEHAVFYSVSFPYSQLDLGAKTTIIVIKDFGEDKYEVDFSRIK